MCFFSRPFFNLWLLQNFLILLFFEWFKHVINSKFSNISFLFFQYFFSFGSSEKLNLVGNSNFIGWKGSVKNLAFKFDIGFIFDIVYQRFKLQLILTTDILLISFIQQLYHLQVNVEYNLSAHIVTVLFNQLLL